MKGESRHDYRTAALSLAVSLVVSAAGSLTTILITRAQLRHEDAAQRADFRRETYSKFYDAAVDAFTVGNRVIVSTPSPTQQDKAAVFDAYSALRRSTFDVFLVGSTRTADVATAAVTEFGEAYDALAAGDQAKASQKLADFIANRVLAYSNAVKADLGL